MDMKLRSTDVCSARNYTSFHPETLIYDSFTTEAIWKNRLKSYRNSNTFFFFKWKLTLLLQTRSTRSSHTQLFFKCDSMIEPQRVYFFFLMMHYHTDVIQAQAALTKFNSSCAVDFKARRNMYPIVFSQFK